MDHAGDDKTSTCIGDGNPISQSVTNSQTKDTQKTAGGYYLRSTCKMRLSSCKSVCDHMRTKHPEMKTDHTPKKISCLDCKATNYISCQLLEFIINYHNEGHADAKQNIIQNGSFATEAEYKTWKESLEEQHKTTFLQCCGEKSFNDHKILYYNCFCSGFFSPKRTRKRKSKAKGLSGIGNKCFAFIKESISKSTGQIKVTYCVDHSHDIQSALLKLSKHFQDNTFDDVEDSGKDFDIHNNHKLKGDNCDSNSRCQDRALPELRAEVITEIVQILGIINSTTDEDELQHIFTSLNYAKAIVLPGTDHQ